MIVVGFSVVRLTVSIKFCRCRVSSVLSVCLALLGANFNMADGDSVVDAVILVTVSVEGEIVDLAVIEFIILSIIDTGFSVVPPFTFEKNFVIRYIKLIFDYVFLPVVTE